MVNVPLQSLIARACVLGVCLLDPGLASAGSCPMRKEIVVGSGGVGGVDVYRDDEGWSTIPLVAHGALRAANIDSDAKDDLLFVDRSNDKLYAYANHAELRVVTNTARRPFSYAAATRPGTSGQASNGVVVVVQDDGPTRGLFFVDADGRRRIPVPSPVNSALPGNELPTVAAGDLNGNGITEIVASFGAHGLWIYSDLGEWKPIHRRSSVKIQVAKFGADAGARIVVDFGADVGLYAYHPGENRWRQLHRESPKTFLTANLDGSARLEVIADFGTERGIWMLENFGDTWTRLSEMSAEDVAAGDLDGDGRDELAFALGEHGLWLRRSQNPDHWRKLTDDSTGGMVFADLDRVCAPR